MKAIKANENGISLKAYGKINLYLDIVKKREDGFHDLNMVMQSISLFDLVKIELNDKGIIETHCYKNGIKMVDIPTDEKNIASKAAKVFFESCKINDYGCYINVEKNIPQMAGMAGGSADGAAVLIGLNHLFNDILNLDELINLGKKIGADIPFCLVGGTAMVGGIGEKIEKINYNCENIYAIISKPDVGISTKEAFKKFDLEYQKDNHITTDIQYNFNAFCDLIKKNSFNQYTKKMYNRFLEYCDEDKINQTLKYLKMLNKSTENAIMTGSGSACFCLFDNYEQAKSAFEDLKYNLVNNDNFLCSFQNKSVVFA